VSSAAQHLFQAGHKLGDFWEMICCPDKLPLRELDAAISELTSTESPIRKAGTEKP